MVRFVEMKRVIEIFDEESENSGLKKVRFTNENDESGGALDRNEGEEHSVSVENGGVDSGKVEKNGDLFEDIVSDDLEGPSRGGLNNSNIGDFDINLDFIFGDEEQPEGLVFDLNLPAYRPQNGGMENDCLEYTQEPVINENKVDVIDILSDDSDTEVEIIGYTCGYNNAKGKQIELGMPSDRMENLNLGLGMMGMNNVIGGSSILRDGERRFTREEKGKAVVIDPWLSLKAPSPIGLNLLADSAELIRASESEEEDVEVETWQPAELPVRSELAGRALQQAEQPFSYRDTVLRESWKESAKQFVRRNLRDRNNAKESSSQQQQLPTVNPIEQLGNFSGPFSDALRMVRERTSKRGAQQLIEWKPSKENQDRSVTGPFVPSLLDLSLKALAENAEGMVSLELVPDNLRERLTGRLCDTRKMNARFMNLLLEGCPTEIRIKNCSWLTETQFQQTFGNCQTKNLRVLQLDLCGQCVLDFAFKDILSHSSNSFSGLAILSLRGACRLSDSGLKSIVMSAPSLRSINLGQCTLLTSNAINCIADSLGSNLRELYIDDCQKINPMLILPAFKKFMCLEVLSVAGIHSITDQFISEMINVCGRSIKELDLADCLKLTDCSLKAIASNCADLCSLNIASLPNLTDLGMEYLANGCRSIRKLKMCRNEFSDEAMAAYIESSGEYLTELLLNHMAKVGPSTAFSLAKRSRKLLSLDISWCRKITSEALGLIVDSCLSLKLLKVFGCRQITNVFLYGHSNPDVRIIGLNLAPILDHVNLLEPQGVLLRYSPLSSSQ